MWQILVLLVVSSVQLTADDSIRAVVDKYFDAYVKRDIDAYAALWDPASPDLPSRRQAVAQLFATSRYSFSSPRISRLKMDGSTANVWITTRRTMMRGDTSFVTDVALALDLKTYGNEWKITREASAVAELARMLAGAASDSERNELLSLDPALLTRELVALLHGESDRLFARKVYDRVLDLNQLIQRIANQTGLSGDEASAWRAMGDAHFYRKEYPKALDAYQKSLALEENLRRDYDLMNLWMSVAVLFTAMDRQAEAIDAYSKSVALGEKVGDKSGTADALERISKIHQDEGRFGEASKVLVKALTLRETMFDRAAIAATLIRLAELEYDQGEADAAIGYYRRSLAVYETLGRPEAEVYALHNIANICYLQGNYEVALATYRREVERAASNDNTRATAAAQTGIGLILTIYGDYAGALDSYQKALEVWRRTTELVETANARQKVGATYFRLGDFVSAEEHYREELRLRDALKDEQETAWAQLDVVTALNAQGKLDEALSLNERSLGLFESAKNASGMATALTTLSGVRYSRKEFDASLGAADRAAAVAKGARDFDMYWQARHRAGKANVCLLQFDAARRAFLDAIATIDSKYALLPGVRPQRLLEPRIAPFLAMVDLSVSQNRGADALAFSERGKQLVLRSILESQRLKINKTMTREEISRQTEIAKNISTLTTQLYREREKQSSNAARLESLSAKIAQARSDQTTFEDELYKRRPEVKTIRAESAALSFREIQNLSWPKGTVIFEYTESEEQIYLFVLTREANAKGRTSARVQAFPLGVSRNDIAEHVMGLARGVSTKGDGWEAHARWLYDVLVKPAASAMTGKQELLVIPDGIAWNVPFAALLVSDSEFLIEKIAISISSSITAFDHIQRHARRQRPVSQDTAPITEFTQSSTVNDASPFFSLIEGRELRSWLDTGFNSTTIVLSSSELTPKGISAGRGLTGFWWILYIGNSDSSLVSRWQSDASAAAQLVGSFRTRNANAKSLQLAIKELISKPGYRHPFLWSGLTFAGPSAVSFR